MKALLVLLFLGAVGHAEPLAVEIKPASLAWHTGKPVDVALRVVNASSTTQTFHAMSCSWPEHWKSADAALAWTGWGCTRNGLQTIELGPGQAYEKTLAMFATATAVPGRHQLRLSFTPRDGATIWSAPVAITLER